MAVDAREKEAIRAVVERLTEAYGTTRTPEEVEATVAEAYASFKDRPVRDFVPVLVERKARAALDNEASITE
ncbi:three-helix bundle dimerization domain-containing protein [Streptomyces sp. NPDC001922]|uniref:three-helix bundle dimerization domain-containing protein n=1 Tax=Streptomyces sp. NPDC001922 TaxID=3364624 RepID=UPI0036BD04C7